MLIIRFVHSLARFLQYRKQEIYLINDKRNETIYYVIQTLLRGTWFEYHQGHFFGIGIDDEYLLFSALAYEQ